MHFLVKAEPCLSLMYFRQRHGLQHWDAAAWMVSIFLCNRAAAFPLPLQILLSFLTPGGNRLHNQICEVLDMDLIRQQAEHSAVDIQGLANYVINTMGKICAPVRDEDIRELKATTNIEEKRTNVN